MRTNAYHSYLEDEILTAEPLKLVQLLYRGAVDSIGNARRYLVSGDIRARSNAVTKALNILTELIQSLDHTQGGELSQNLLRVYDYAQRLLISANANQTDAPLAEAERLVSTLLDAWQQTQSKSTRAATAQYLNSEPAHYERLSCACQDC